MVVPWLPQLAHLVAKITTKISNCGFITLGAVHGHLCRADWLLMTLLIEDTTNQHFQLATLPTSDGLREFPTLLIFQIFRWQDF